MSKLITVYGATGAQGSSVLRSLSFNITSPPPFRLRGITRNPSSPAAKTLASSIPNLGLVQADGWDKSSLIAAFKDSWAVFVNTNSDDPVFENAEEKRTEEDLGKGIVDAAVEAGVSVFVYSGMTSAHITTEGKVPVAAFDDKYAIGEYAKSTNAFKSTVIVSAGWYFENFLVQEMAPIFGGFPYIPAEDGTLVFRAPKWGGKEDVPFIAMRDDFGDIVHGVLLEPEKWDGGFVQGVSHICSLESMVEDFEKATGKRARFEEIPNWRDLEVYGVRALETVKLMFGFCQESGGRYYGVETENQTAAELKKKGAEACGKSGDGVALLTSEKVFKREFAGEGTGE
ncbi:NAD(P)-binding protein [Polyplosphaeria fusca]|uniref:NAD(P)-binding protein n=1 Tax=Polyplosphaeria fusca TaxID=682080 RepID=A0A9P4UXC7_9PLEO|nr:NAD(P)-binding protein [Polyplosphaeria fusca]